MNNNTSVPQFSTQTPFLTTDSKAGSGVSFTHTKFFQALQVRANSSAQVASVPATSSAAGTPGSLAADANWLYVCVATDSWKRVALSTF